MEALKYIFNIYENITRYFYVHDVQFTIYLCISIIIILVSYKGSTNNKNDGNYTKNINVSFFIVIPLLFFILTIIISLIGFSYFWGIKYGTYIIKTHFIDKWHFYALSLIVSVIIRLGFRRYCMPKISGFFHNRRIKAKANSKSDITKDVNKLKSQSYNLIKHFKDDAFFIGLNTKRKPVYIKKEKMNSYNGKIIGPTQTGKGVLIGSLLYQYIEQGSSVVFIDAKPDKHARAIIEKASRKKGVPVYELDLVEGTKTKYEPFLYGKKTNIRTKLQTLFKTKSTGTNADFYKFKETKELDKILSSKTWDKTIKGLKKHVDSVSKIKNNNNLETTLNILTSLLFIPMYENEKAKTFNLKTLAKKQCVFYIKTSITDETILNLTNVLIQDILILILASYQTGRKHHIHINIDEARFFISNLLADSLSIISGFNANIFINYQSINDLLNLNDKNLNSKAIESSVNINTKFSVYYQAGDYETAERIANRSGEIIKRVSDRHQVDINDAGGELMGGQSSMMDIEENLVTKNQVMVLPPKVGVLFTAESLAQIIFTHWIDVSDQDLTKHKYYENFVKTKLVKNNINNEYSPDTVISEFENKNINPKPDDFA